MRASSMAEHGTHNPDVIGSTPVPATEYVRCVDQSVDP